MLFFHEVNKTLLHLDQTVEALDDYNDHYNHWQNYKRKRAHHWSRKAQTHAATMTDLMESPRVPELVLSYQASMNFAFVTDQAYMATLSARLDSVLRPRHIEQILKTVSDVIEQCLDKLPAALCEALHVEESKAWVAQTRRIMALNEYLAECPMANDENPHTLN